MQSDAVFQLWFHVSPLRGSSLMMKAGPIDDAALSGGLSCYKNWWHAIAKFAPFVKDLDTIIDLSFNWSPTECNFMFSPSNVCTLINLELKIATG